MNLEQEKTTAFFWSWGDERPSPDPVMTRKRAARMLRAWRRMARQPGEFGTVEMAFERMGMGIYRCTNLGWGGYGTMFVCRQIGRKEWVGRDGDR